MVLFSEAGFEFGNLADVSPVLAGLGPVLGPGAGGSRGGRDVGPVFNHCGCGYAVAAGFAGGLFLRRLRFRYEQPRFDPGNKVALE